MRQPGLRGQPIPGRASSRINIMAVQMHSPEISPPEATTARRGITTGVIAGTIGISCCVGPTVAALLGVSSAAYAVDLATDLYDDWGWAFKAAGSAFAVGAVVAARRQAAACSVEKPRLGKFVATVAVTGVGTYAALYGLTTWLGEVSARG